MSSDQLCAAFDAQPRKLLRPGRVLPSRPAAPTLQPCAWVPRCTALDVCAAARQPACGTATQAPARHVPVGRSMLTPSTCNGAEGHFPGTLEGESHASNCTQNELCRKWWKIFSLFSAFLTRPQNLHWQPLARTERNYLRSIDNASSKNCTALGIYSATDCG